jgi:hypothetical protein
LFHHGLTSPRVQFKCVLKQRTSQLFHHYSAKNEPVVRRKEQTGSTVARQGSPLRETGEKRAVAEPKIKVLFGTPKSCSGRQRHVRNDQELFVRVVRNDHNENNKDLAMSILLDAVKDKLITTFVKKKMEKHEKGVNNDSFW